MARGAAQVGGRRGLRLIGVDGGDPGDAPRSGAGEIDDERPPLVDRRDEDLRLYAGTGRGPADLALRHHAG